MHIDLSDKLLADPAYEVRIRLRGYTCERSAIGAATDRDAANILIRANPAWSRDDHARLAELHRIAGEQQEKQYQVALNLAAHETFGRPFNFWDYRVCCIGREEFGDAWKEILRYHGYAGPKHKALFAAHLAASKSRKIH